MELAKIIKLKILFFTNENCFFNFKNILLKLAYDIYIKKQHDSLTDRIEKRNKNYLSSNWCYIMKLIFSKTYILDFSNIKDLEDKNHNYMIKDLKSYEIDKFQYLFLKNICINKLEKLNYLSYKLKISLINIIQIYLDLCIKEILNNRNKQLSYLKEKKLLFNRNNDIDNLNPKFPFIRLGNKRRNTKLNKLFFNNFLKNDMPILKISKNKKQNDETITNIISKNNNTIDLFGKRNNSAKQKLLYCNSFTRLFIGETDNESVLKRHLSNILVLKQNRLKVNGSYIDLSEGYLKNLFNKIYQKNSRQLLLDDYLKKTLDKFKVDQKYVNEINKKYSIKPCKKLILKKFTKLNNDIKIIDCKDYNDKNDFENQILKTYNYNNNKNKFEKDLRKINSEKTKKIINLKYPKKIKIIKNGSTVLIDNFYTKLSNSDLFSKKINNKRINKDILEKTDIEIQNKNKILYLKNNYSYNNHFRNNTFKNSSHFNIDYKYFLTKNDLFF